MKFTNKKQKTKKNQHFYNLKIEAETKKITTTITSRNIWFKPISVLYKFILSYLFVHTLVALNVVCRYLGLYGQDERKLKKNTKIFNRI